MRKGQFLVLLTAIFALAFANATFARNYPLTVAGIRVTDTNCTNITGTGIVGSVSYNHATRTLTLNNATITHSQHIIEADSTLTVKLVGTNALQNISGLGDALYAKGDSLVIEGPEGSSLRSVVFCSGTNSRYGTHLIVRGGCTLYAYGHYGLTATGARTGEYLTIDKSTVIARGATDYSIGGFANIIYRCSAPIIPTGASYNTTSKRMALNGIPINDTVIIDAVYPVKIGTISVSKYNADSIIGQEVLSGLVRYVDSTKTLILRRANIQSSSYAILCDSNITIEFYDSNLVTCNTSCIRINGQNASIVSSPNSTLTLNGYNVSSTIWARNLTINTPGFLDVSHVIRSYSLDTLTILNSRLRTKQINGYTKVIFDECAVVDPPGSYYDSLSKKLINPVNAYYSGMYLIDTVMGQSFRMFPIYIEGVRVTTANAGNIQTTNSTGNATYDPVSNTLSLTNFVLDCYATGIKCDSSITIVINGQNTISTRNYVNMFYPAIELNGSDNIIRGTPGNHLDAMANRTPAIKAKYNLELNNVNMFATGKGIERESIYIDTLGVLRINRSNIKIYAEVGSGYISYFNRVDLNNCEIVAPAGANYSTTQRKIILPDGSLIRYDTLIIERSQNNIISADEASTHIFPNPVSTNLHILSQSAIAQLQVFDTYGRLLKTLTPNAKQAIVNVRELQNGVYTIKIKTDGGIITKRFVVRH